MEFPSTVILASQNQHKKTEIEALLNLLGFSGKLLLLSALEEKGAKDLSKVETGKTFYENALLKAQTIFDRFECASLADDSGIVVPSLSDAPGIYSARYAGVDASDKENNKKLLKELSKKHGEERKAFFKTVVVLVYIDKDHHLKVAHGEGAVHGEVLRVPRGKNGFGYDPIFLPEGSKKAFGELEEAEKNCFSHRSIAIKNLFKQFESF